MKLSKDSDYLPDMVHAAILLIETFIVDVEQGFDAQGQLQTLRFAIDDLRTGLDSMN